MDSERVKTNPTYIYKILPFAGILTIFTTTVVSGPSHGLMPPNVLYERGTNTPSFKFKVDYQSEFFQLPVDSQVLLGKWKGRRDAGIKFEVDFRSDGSYTYMVGQNGVLWLTHIGGYQLRPSRVAAVGESKTILMLTPTRILRKPGSAEQDELEHRGLMDNSPHEYRIQFYPYASDGEQLFLLDVRQPPGGTKDWRLHWQGQPRFQRTP